MHACIHMDIGHMDKWMANIQFSFIHKSQRFSLSVSFEFGVYCVRRSNKQWRCVGCAVYASGYYRVCVRVFLGRSHIRFDTASDFDSLFFSSCRENVGQVEHGRCGTMAKMMAIGKITTTKRSKNRFYTICFTIICDCWKKSFNI